MKVSATLTFDSVEDAIEGLARLRGVGRAEIVRADPAQPAADVKSAKDPKAEKAAKDQAAKEKAAASTGAAASSQPTAAETAPAAQETKVAETSASSTASASAVPDYAPIGLAIKSAAASASAVPDYAPIGLAIKSAAATHREGVVALLTKFNAKKGTDLKPEQYEAFSTELAALVAPPDDLG